MNAPRKPAPPAPVVPLTEAEIEELQALLDKVPAPLEPLDVVMLDGFLCGVLVQPRPVPAARWLPFVTDMDGRPLTGRFDISRLNALVRRRHAELDQAIAERDWFDPWVFEHDDEELDPVYPWVAGFAAACEEFSELMDKGGQALTAPLALLYRHLDPEDLEDADDLIEEMESLEPPADMTEAVEELVRATLLLADIARPVDEPEKKPAAKTAARPAAKKTPPRHPPAKKRAGPPGR
jgi:uncharacterized protein